MNNPNAFEYQCNWRLAFNLKGGQKGAVGYLLALSGLGGLRLRKDIRVWNPFDGPGQQAAYRGPHVDCIGLLETFYFQGGENDPVRLTGYVSKATAADLRSQMARPLATIKLKLSWYIVDFDNEAKAWFEVAFIQDSAGAAASLSSADGKLQLFIANTPEKISEELDVPVYRFELEVLPSDESSANLEFASGPKQKLVRKWAAS